ncbi:MAG: hypothetical protein HZB29_02120 [Nitrospinae bacterium]|nr:hypothetical protein [Nitrospinota bacterium]
MNRSPEKPDALERLAGRIVFGTGAFLFFALQLALSLTPIALRTSPLETDDAYVYIFKAAQLESCFFQGCPAMDDLRRQLTAPADGPKMAAKRAEYYGQAFIVHNLLHSAILSAIHKLGAGWDTAYNITSSVGAALSYLSIAWLFLEYLGAGAAGMALLALAPMVFAGHGIQYMAPGSLTTGMAILTFALMRRWRDWAGPILVTACAAMVMNHSAGRIYALMAIVYYLLTASRPMRQRFLAAGVSMAIVIIYSLAPLFVIRPELGSLSVGAQPGLLDVSSRLSLIGPNIEKAGEIIGQWAGFYFGVPLTAVLLIAGAALIPRRRRTAYLALLIVCLLTLAATLLHIYPGMPATLFERIWTFAAILLSGLIGQALWKFIELPLRLRQNRPAAALILAAALLGSAAMSAGRFKVWALDKGFKMREAAETAIVRYNTLLDESQPAKLLARAVPGEQVLYGDMISMLFYLSNGAHSLGAVFLPGVKGEPEEKRLTGDNARIRHIVARNPVTLLPIASQGALRITSFDKLEIRFEGKNTPDYAMLDVTNRSAETVNLALEPVDGKEAQTFTLKPGFAGKIKLELKKASPPAGHIFRIKEMDGEVILRAINLPGSGAYIWPWDQGVSLTYWKTRQRPIVKLWEKGLFVTPQNALKPDEEYRTARFDSSALFPSFGRPVTVIDDNGYTVLAQL